MYVFMYIHSKHVTLGKGTKNFFPAFLILGIAVLLYTYYTYICINIVQSNKNIGYLLTSPL